MRCSRSCNANRKIETAKARVIIIQKDKSRSCLQGGTDLRLVHIPIESMAEAEGLEPPSAFARRFSRPLTYQLAYASTRKGRTRNITQTFADAQAIGTRVVASEFSVLKRQK